MYVETYETSSLIILFSNMRFFVMFVTAVCVLFLIPTLSFLKEMLDNNYSVKHLMNKWKVGNYEAFKALIVSFSNEPAFDERKTNSIENALGTSLKYQVPKIFPLCSTLYILERVAGKICIHLSQFSETEALCSKNNY